MPALKSSKEVGGRGEILTYVFNLKVYPTNFMPFFLDNFLPTFWICDTSVPSPAVAPPLNTQPCLDDQFSRKYRCLDHQLSQKKRRLFINFIDAANFASPRKPQLDMKTCWSKLIFPFHIRRDFKGSVSPLGVLLLMLLPNQNILTPIE